MTMRSGDETNLTIGAEGLLFGTRTLQFKTRRRRSRSPDLRSWKNS
jgi:hypothetical protein